MEALEWMVLLALSILGALKSEAAVYWWTGQEAELRFWNSLAKEHEDTERKKLFWMSRRFFKQIIGWLTGYVVFWLLSEKQMITVRFFDLFASYLILSAVDGKRRVVPDSILAFFLMGQLLCGAVSMPLSAGLEMLASGVLFLLAAILFANLSGGQIGMGDAKLLGITAMIAGWSYVVQIFGISILLSFLYSIFLLVIYRKSKKTEFPFVPFLTGGMLVHFLLLFGMA